MHDFTDAIGLKCLVQSEQEATWPMAMIKWSTAPSRNLFILYIMREYSADVSLVLYKCLDLTAFAFVVGQHLWEFL